MKKGLYCSMVVTIVLLLGFNVPLVSAVSLPDIPKPSIPSVPSVPSIPVPAKPAAVSTAPAKPAAVSTAPVPGAAGLNRDLKTRKKESMTELNRGN
jgi:hypothetical protein